MRHGSGLRTVTRGPFLIKTSQQLMSDKSQLEREPDLLSATSRVKMGLFLELDLSFTREMLYSRTTTNPWLQTCMRSGSKVLLQEQIERFLLIQLLSWITLLIIVEKNFRLHAWVGRRNHSFNSSWITRLKEGFPLVMFSRSSFQVSIRVLCRRTDSSNTELIKERDAAAQSHSTQINQMNITVHNTRPAFRRSRLPFAKNTRDTRIHQGVFEYWKIESTGQILKQRRIKELPNVIRKKSMEFTAKFSFLITIKCCYEDINK